MYGVTWLVQGDNDPDMIEASLLALLGERDPRLEDLNADGGPRLVERPRPSRPWGGRGEPDRDAAGGSRYAA